ncbi:CoxG family protein [Peristeroidobacter soli]|uniref:CoxG family protein n=1 Tax=Peristeroidobacter soli TaxID=2497877 RepID=UPI00101D249B|nr:carbon monoxide dehydrogenase subunit G [Peristeroidobacter soli]
MAMQMSGEVALPATRETVWEKLNDPEVLKACIPGCEELDVVSETEFVAVATNKIGPIKARFKGRVHLSDMNPPFGYRLAGEGEGGIAGFARMSANVKLDEAETGTVLCYDVDAQFGGRMAQLGSRLVQSAAKKLADDFFNRFAAVIRDGGIEVVNG